jgi:hypothetical protein
MAPSYVGPVVSLRRTQLLFNSYNFGSGARFAGQAKAAMGRYCLRGTGAATASAGVGIELRHLVRRARILSESTEVGPKGAVCAGSGMPGWPAALRRLRTVGDT